MLRGTLVAIGGLLVLGGLALMLVAHETGGLAPLVAGLVLLGALTFERYRYKRVLDSVPGPDWQPTGERFREPGTDMTIVVYYQPRTGRRAYVRLSAGSMP